MMIWLIGQVTTASMMRMINHPRGRSQARKSSVGNDCSHPTTSNPTTTTAQAKFVNDHCPIEGGAINPASVPADLVREYKGQKVAFCCGDCPAKWDKLTDAEKDAKLEKVKAK